MLSRTFLIPLWILLFLLVGFLQGVEGADNSTVDGNDGANGADLLPNVTGNGTSASNGTSPPPNFVVESSTGNPCILATFNISLRVSYSVKSKTIKNEYIAFKDIVVPRDAEMVETSVCGETVSSLIVEWDNSTFSLNLTFSSHGIKNGGVHTNWSLDAIAFGYNLSNHDVFPAAAEREYVSVNKTNLALFNTPIGHAIECDSNDVKVELGRDEQGADLVFHYAKFAAFNLTSDDFPNEVDQCSAGVTSRRKEDIMVPLIIACSLSLIVVIVVIAYAISRKVQEARDQNQYKPMP